MEGKDHEVTEGKDHKKKSKILGVELKNYLLSLVPHIESSNIKYSTSKDITKVDLCMENTVQYGQDAFKEFLKSEFSDENIEFWLACEDYKKTQADHLHSKAEKIYKEFVQSDATKQVNIDFHTRKDIAKKAQDPTPSSFDEAQRLVFVLMERDSYPRFLKSRFYLNLLSKVECNNLK
ncbi:hypothetical protein JD844_017405 [Phrynosoma platyrhinos]|uniref:Regulator of G-protein signaling 1 n=1 Tax=Phrynosoma platyrhinos TaxID=52577 RepID=A0ABQ7SLT3_PHRPL|nr:hypothetical protein JD844_017405 [Phrynosoma platyrhinos]